MHSDQNQADKFARMTQTPIPRLITTLAVPTIISMMITSVYNMADTFFVGRIGTSATGAVGVVFSLMAVIQAIGFMFGQGSGNYIARSLGGQDFRDASRMSATGFFSALIVGGLITLFGLIFLDPLVRLLGATETILPYARDYARYILLGASYMTASLVLNNQLRFQGSASYAMVGIAAGGILNIALDPLFIFVFHMGIAGAAIATVISQFVSFCILLVGCTRGGNIRIHFRDFTPRWELYREILRGGLPSLWRQGLASVATICLNLAAGPYGDAAIAAMSIVSRVNMFASSALIGFGQGFQPVCSYCFGAGLYDRVKKACWFCIRVSTIILLVLSVISFPAARSIITLFRRNDPTVIEIGTLALRLQLITLPLQGAVIMGNMMPQSIGYGFRATLVSTARQGIFLIPLLTIMTYTMGLLGIQCAQPLADIATFILSLFVIRGIFKEFPEDVSSFAAQ